MCFQKFINYMSKSRLRDEEQVHLLVPGQEEIGCKLVSLKSLWSFWSWKEITLSRYLLCVSTFKEILRDMEGVCGMIISLKELEDTTSWEIQDYSFPHKRTEYGSWLERRVLRRLLVTQKRDQLLRNVAYIYMCGIHIRVCVSIYIYQCIWYLYISCQVWDCCEGSV